MTNYVRVRSLPADSYRAQQTVALTRSTQNTPNDISDLRTRAVDAKSSRVPCRDSPCAQTDSADADRVRCETQSARARCSTPATRLMCAIIVETIECPRSTTGNRIESTTNRQTTRMRIFALRTKQVRCIDGAGGGERVEQRKRQRLLVRLFEPHQANIIFFKKTNAKNESKAT
jgi:hypothetical protein